jgi:hypothetical protein
MICFVISPKKLSIPWYPCDSLCYLYIPPTGIPWGMPEITEITGIDIPWYQYVSLFLLNMKESPWPETVTSIPVIFSFFQST